MNRVQQRWFKDIMAEATPEECASVLNDRIAELEAQLAELKKQKAEPDNFRRAEKIVSEWPEWKRDYRVSPVAEKVRYGSLVFLDGYHDLPDGTKLYAAPVVPDGMVLVPKSAFDWLMGLGDDFEPDRKGRYWWRSKFREMIAAAQENAAMCGGRNEQKTSDGA